MCTKFHFNTLCIKSIEVYLNCSIFIFNYEKVAGDTG